MFIEVILFFILFLSAKNTSEANGNSDTTTEGIYRITMSSSSSIESQEVVYWVVIFTLFLPYKSIEITKRSIPLKTYSFSINVVGKVHTTSLIRFKTESDFQNSLVKLKSSLSQDNGFDIPYSQDKLNSAIKYMNKKKDYFIRESHELKFPSQKLKEPFEPIIIGSSNLFTLEGNTSTVLLEFDFRNYNHPANTQFKYFYLESHTMKKIKNSKYELNVRMEGKQIVENFLKCLQEMTNNSLNGEEKNNQENSRDVEKPKFYKSMSFWLIVVFLAILSSVIIFLLTLSDCTRQIGRLENIDMKDKARETIFEIVMEDSEV